MTPYPNTGELPAACTGLPPDCRQPETLQKPQKKPGAMRASKNTKHLKTRETLQNNLKRFKQNQKRLKTKQANAFKKQNASKKTTDVILVNMN